MEQFVVPLSSTLSEAQVGSAGHLGPGDPEAEAEANKQRRKIQNRKNQRARRSRLREQVPGPAQTPRSFQVRRWRTDEVEDCPTRDALSASKNTVSTHMPPGPPRIHNSVPVFSSENPGVFRGPSPTILVPAKPSLTPPCFIFPLSTDHLLYLVQYNVFRAFASNKRTLNVLLTGWAEKPSSPSTCPMGGPYRDDTTVYPLSPNIPPCLYPTRLQQTRYHSLWINFFPFPRLRDNLIRREGSFDHWDLLQDLIGELMGATPQQGNTHAFTVSDPEPRRTPSLTTGRDDDEVTAGRRGLIVWGEPHDMHNWEATPAFFKKWWWAVEGCSDLVESSNRWRRMRGEEPLCCS